MNELDMEDNVHDHSKHKAVSVQTDENMSDSITQTRQSIVSHEAWTAYVSQHFS